MAELALGIDQPVVAARRSGAWISREWIWFALAVVTASVIGLVGERSAFALAVLAGATAISVRRPAIGLAALVASVPIQDGWLAHIGSFSLTWTRLLLFSLLMAMSIRLVCGRQRVTIPSIAWVFAAYVLALVASVTEARDVSSWAEETYRWTVALVVLVAAANATSDRGGRRWLLNALGVGIAGGSVVAVYQVWTQTGPETFNQRGLLRAYGLFGEPNPFAAYLEIAALPFLAVVSTAFWKGRDDIPRLLAWISFLVGALGIVTLLLTQSRGGLLGLFAGIAIIVWFTANRTGRIAVIGGCLLCLMALSTPPAREIRASLGISATSSSQVQVSPENFAVHERMAHWGAASGMWREQPLTGVGAGNYSERFREFTPEWRFRIPRGHAHNNYLQAAAQSGSIGLICYLALLVVAWRHCRRQLRRAITNEHRAFCAGALAVTGALAVHGMFEYTHVLSLGIPLSAIWASTGTAACARLNETAADGHD